MALQCLVPGGQSRGHLKPSLSHMSGRREGVAGSHKIPRADVI